MPLASGSRSSEAASGASGGAVEAAAAVGDGVAAVEGSQ